MHYQSDPSFVSSRVANLFATMTSLGLLLLSLSSAATAQARYVTFDPPGATTTFVWAMNDSGQIAGEYYSGTLGSSFIRNSDGSFATFNPPGATNSTATSINNSGEVAGYFYDGTEYEGYFRSASGEITAFTVSGSTLAYGINDAGSIIGQSGNGAFVRDPDGTVTSFNAFGASTTYVSNINKAGYIAGEYTNTPGTDLTGYIRSPSGVFTMVSVPGSAGQGTTSTEINDDLEMTGSYTDSRGLNHGFLRSANGIFTTFNVLGTLITQGVQINDAGQIVGYSNSKSSSVNVGFLRNPSGAISAFQVPGAALGFLEGTRSIAINASAMIAGYYYDASGFPHGFIRY